ncbi:hypothetical protein BKA56DRAFT_291594, partial [Ilyonectria sp. MPI-CAGE-AT-0026]
SHFFSSSFFICYQRVRPVDSIQPPLSPETTTVRHDTVHPASYSVRRPRPTIRTPSRIQHTPTPRRNQCREEARLICFRPAHPRARRGTRASARRARDERIRRHEQQRPHCQSSSHAAALAIRTCCNLPASMWLQDSAGPGGNVDSKLTTDNTSIGPIEGASSTLQYHHPILCPSAVRPLRQSTIPGEALETKGQTKLSEIDTRSFWAKLLRCRLVPVRRSPFCLSHPHSLSQPRPDQPRVLASLRDSRFQ